MQKSLWAFVLSIFLVLGLHAEEFNKMVLDEKMEEMHETVVGGR